MSVQPMNPRDLHGHTLALVLGRDIMGVDILSSIRWRVYGYGAGKLWLRSVDGGVKSTLTVREFEELRDCHRIVVCEHDPSPHILERRHVKN